MSKADAAWINLAFSHLFPGRDITTVTPNEFYEKVVLLGFGWVDR